MKRNGDCSSWLLITQINRGTRQLLGWNTNLIKAMIVRVVKCVIFYKFCSKGFVFKVDNLILKSSIFWIFKLWESIVFTNFQFFFSVPSFKNISRVDFCASFFSLNWIKVTSMTSFQGHINSQKYKNPSRIIYFF